MKTRMIFRVVSAGSMVTILATMATGCFYQRARYGRGFDAGEYSRLSATLKLPKTLSGWHVLIATERQAGIHAAGPEEQLDLTGTEITIRVRNLSPVALRVAAEQPPTLSRRITGGTDALIWRGSFPQKLWAYPLFEADCDQSSEVVVNLEFKPPLKLSKRLIFKLERSPI